jgi:hypothetical protein
MIDGHDFYWRDRFGPAPREPPWVAVVDVRRGRIHGREYRLRGNEKHAVVRVGGDRITLGPNEGMLYNDGDGPSIELDRKELRELARIGEAWSEHRVGWVALSAGGFHLGIVKPRRYRPRTWSGTTIGDAAQMRRGESNFGPVEPATGEKFAGHPVEHAIANGCRERVGVVIRMASGKCLTLVRGSMVISARWPRRTSDLREIGSLLVQQYTDDTWNPGDPGPLAHLGSDAAEIDALGLELLQEAARDLDWARRKSR